MADHFAHVLVFLSIKALSLPWQAAWARGQLVATYKGFAISIFITGHRFGAILQRVHGKRDQPRRSTGGAEAVSSQGWA